MRSVSRCVTTPPRSADAALKEIVRSGGVGPLLHVLHSPEPATRLLALKILVNLAPIGSARDELIAGNALSAAERSCMGLQARSDATRCWELLRALRETLRP